jgi:iron(III) transport system substrate-binding protein
MFCPSQRLLFAAAAVAVLSSLTSCGRHADVSLYVALDQIHSEKLIARFTRETGLVVNARYDTEASKTVGLVAAIIEEAERPRCDVFWNNELAHTVALARRGLLSSYASPSADAIPERFVDPRHRYTGFAARARVLIVNNDLIPDPQDRPRSMWDLLDPRWRGKCGVARPLTGTTLTHFTALRLVLGESEFQRFLDGILENRVVWLQSNGATMREVRAGKLAWAFTDTDDFHVALSKGYPVSCVFPDQGAGELGTMLIPNSLALMDGAPHPEAARKLIDFLLSEAVEAALAASKSAQIPVRLSVRGPTAPEILRLGEFVEMKWNPEATAAHLHETSRLFEARFGR